MRKRMYVFSVFTFLTLLSCGTGLEPDSVMTINGKVLLINGAEFEGDLDGQFVSKGGLETKFFLWQNNENTAGYKADIASALGTFRMVIEDAEGTVVFNETLDGDSSGNSLSGVTDQGVAGQWTVRISLTAFVGAGTFSLNQGQ